MRSFTDTFYFFQLNPSCSQKIKVCLSLLLSFCLCQLPQRAQLPAQNDNTISSQNETIPSVRLISCFDNSSRNHGTQRSKDHFRICYIPTTVCKRVQDSSVRFFSFLLLFSFLFLSSCRWPDLPLFQPTSHLSVHPTNYFLLLLRQIFPHFLKS